MKKTIQTNIGGVVFNIEEDAYDKLKGYLAAIQQYFSKYEGSHEIVSDIENRICEKFFDKQRIAGGVPHNQQVISLDHVNQVVASMGSVADFEAIEEDEDLSRSEAGSQQSATGNPEKVGDSEKAKEANSQQPTANNPIPTKYFRDNKRKVLGGVLAGVANHFKVDVVWIRLIFLILFFGIAPISNGDLAGISGILFIAYIVCWIAFPASNTLEEDTKIKKFYRNPDQKVIGGVASGLSAYFGVDLGVMRFLFVLGIFLGGIGFIAYLLLWIVAPKATTLTQKMEMKGEPVTLSNIETNIKSGLNLDKNDTETPAAKVLLLPFRAIAAVLGVLGDLLKNLGPVIRVFAGIILLIISLAWMFSAIVGAAVFFGIASHEMAPWIHLGDIPAEMLLNDIHPLTGVFGFLAFFLPALAIGLIGISLISNNSLVGQRTYWLTGLGLWIASCLAFGTMAATYSLNFARNGSYETTKTFPINKKVLILDANDNYSDFLGNVSLEMEGNDGNEIKLDEKFSAKGNTRDVAEKNAQAINYKIVQKDSVLIFDDELSLAPKAKYRNPRLEMTLYLPYNQPFTMTKTFFERILRNDLHDKYEFDSDDLKKYTFTMKKDSGIVCLNCIAKKVEKDEDNSAENNNDDNNSNVAEGLFAESMFDENGEHSRNFNLNNFQKIKIEGAFVVNVKQGNNFNISTDSDEKSALDDLKATVDATNTLVLNYAQSASNHHKQVRVNITMPKLEAIELSGASSGKVQGFEAKNDLSVNLSGASKLALDMKLNNLSLDASGASIAEFIGSAEKAKVNLSGASQLQAKNMKINSAETKASDASSANFGNVSDFHSNTSGASSVSREN